MRVKRFVPNPLEKTFKAGAGKNERRIGYA
jgi:hypothetical protein